MCCPIAFQRACASLHSLHDECKWFLGDFADTASRQFKAGFFQPSVRLLLIYLPLQLLPLQLFHVTGCPKTPAAAAATSLQSCPTLCDPIDGSPPGSPVPGILQARTLEWVAICFSNAWKWKVKVKSLSRVQLLATPWTAAHQAPPFIGFSRQGFWSGVPLPSPPKIPEAVKR